MPREEEIFVLFGSQTGNSEQAAQDFCEQVPEKLSPQAIAKVTGVEGITIKPRNMQLDDFLELERAPWTRLIVVFTSSYGVGQAPLGCYRFRDLCDELINRYAKNSKAPPILEGVTYAMCGLGDSKFTTFFENPSRIDEALKLAGSVRVGPLGKADASGQGDEDQQKVIATWIDGIWPHLAKLLATDPPSCETLKNATKETVKICCEINPEFQPELKKGTIKSIVAPVVVGAIAIAWYCLS